MSNWEVTYAIVGSSLSCSNNSKAVWVLVIKNSERKVVTCKRKFLLKESRMILIKFILLNLLVIYFQFQWFSKAFQRKLRRWSKKILWELHRLLVDTTNFLGYFLYSQKKDRLGIQCIIYEKLNLVPRQTEEESADGKLVDNWEVRATSKGSLPSNTLLARLKREPVWLIGQMGTADSTKFNHDVWNIRNKISLTVSDANR